MLSRIKIINNFTLIRVRFCHQIYQKIPLNFQIFFNSKFMSKSLWTCMILSSVIPQSQPISSSTLAILQLSEDSIRPLPIAHYASSYVTILLNYQLIK